MEKDKCHRCKTKTPDHENVLFIQTWKPPATGVDEKEIELCSGCFGDFLDYLANIEKISNQEVALLATCKALIQNADNSPDGEVDDSGWTKDVRVSSRDLVAMEAAISKAKEVT